MGVGHELRDLSLSPTQILPSSLLSGPQGPFLLVSIADVLNLLKDYKGDSQCIPGYPDRNTAVLS